MADLFEATPLLMAALDETLVCRELSHSWRDLLGVDDSKPISASELFGLDPPAELLVALSRGVRQGSTIDDEPVRISAGQVVLEGRLSAWMVRGRDGRPPRLIVSVADVGALAKSIAELTELQRHHQIILDAAGEGIYGLDARGCVTFGNAATEKILGWRPTDVLGQPAHDVHHHSHADGSPYPRVECPIYAALKDGEVHRIESEVFWHTDGSPVPVEYTSTPIIHGGEPDGAVVVFRDISQRKKAEAQRAEAYAEVKQLTEQLELERDYLRDEINVTANFGEMIGESAALKRTLAQIEAVAATPVSVLVHGESGVGKEMVARAIHEKSDRVGKPLVRVNCASIPKDLFESEFFGHVKGAFTGAHADRVGRLQLADGGTLFLDEVGEIPLPLQSKLLRALQEQEFERVGDDRTVKIDARIVAATNRDLGEEVRAHRFREDLFYRLSVFPIEVPPLRDRPEDVVHLATHFLDVICAGLGREPLNLSRRQVALLEKHDWPGNIRELKNVIERAVILSSGTKLSLDQVSPDQGDATVPPSSPSGDPDEFVTDAEIRANEKANTLAVLKHANGRVWGPNGAARLLGVKPSTLAYRMKKLGITNPSSA